MRKTSRLYGPEMYFSSLRQLRQREKGLLARCRRLERRQRGGRRVARRILRAYSRLERVRHLLRVAGIEFLSHPEVVATLCRAAGRTNQSAGAAFTGLRGRLRRLIDRYSPAVDSDVCEYVAGWARRILLEENRRERGSDVSLSALSNGFAAELQDRLPSQWALTGEQKTLRTVRDELSPRGLRCRAVKALQCCGWSNKEIADWTGLSESTISRLGRDQWS